MLSASSPGTGTRVARLSYTGEPGVEISCRTAHAAAHCEALLVAGTQSTGSYAQAPMRIEKRFLAYDPDLDTGIMPLEAELGFSVDLSGPFIGRDALLRKRDEGVTRTIVSLVFDDDSMVPIGGEPVLIDEAQNQYVDRTSSAAVLDGPLHTGVT